MKVPSLNALGNIRPHIGPDRQVVSFSPKALSIPAGADPLLEQPLPVHDFIMKNRWLHSNCLVGRHGCDNQLLESGAVAMSSSRSLLMRHLFRWEALRIQPVWVDHFDTLPEEQRTVRSKKLAKLDQARLQLRSINSWYQNDQDQYEIARAAVRTGCWELINLPPLGELEWPSGACFNLRNPGMRAESVETAYLEGIFAMLERKAEFKGPEFSVPADELFGVDLMTNESGYELLAKLHIRIEASRADAAYARWQRAIA